MDWWKKTTVPAQHKTFAASYRYGFADAAKGTKMQARSYFSNEGAWSAYQSGYRAGEAKRGELAREEEL